MDQVMIRGSVMMLPLNVGYTLFYFGTLTPFMMITRLTRRITNKNRSHSEGSLTAVGALYGRARGAIMGFNPDSLALRFMRHVNAPWVLWINFQINLRIESLQYWLTRTTFSSQMYRWFKIPIDTATFLQLRTCWIDDFVQEFASRYSNTSSQLVILGAGYDSRCYRLTKLPSGMTKFEVDAQGTQKLKKQILTKINVDHSAVRFVTCDFGTEDWVDKLEEKGFSKNIPTCFVWEGVTVYLTEDDVISTLKTVKQCAPGTIIGYDFNAPWLVSKYKEKTKGFGEEWKFGIPLQN